ncbi:hypothetical protein FEF26_08045 [Nesterenkonia salmonea]|uniref:Phosphotyrosine protein phosphatase I domain-containing protein n=1 Tax=Nesterenkonia salmonea TaxID=1804987 RepID=A0A5R9BAN3_9MICC|nr:hypothetical protein [Nesterenkonia salmonea]TLP97045.1 hypothetical protein FEF26_08045 [Nesterenkonia salmonea]
MPQDHTAPQSGAEPQRNSDEISMIFVCRANRCRSPLAEHIARHRASQWGLAVSTSSMGFLASGAPTPPAGVQAAAEQDIDLSRHLSQQLDPEQLRDADVILASGRAEARDLVAKMPELWPRVFTLKQFDAQLGADPISSEEGFSSWVLRSGESRSRNVLLGSSSRDDIADPVGRPPRIWRRTIRELDELIRSVLGRSAGAIPRAEV